MKLAPKIFGFALGGLVALVVAVLAAGFIFPSWFAPRYKLVTLPSGHSYKVTNKGPIFGRGWKGLAVSYIADTEDPAQLESAAQDLFESLRPEAEAGRVGSVVVMATVIKSKNGPFSTSVNHNVAFERAPTGEWKHQAAAK